ncbi:hypothetical protein HHI36_013724, partial [Cryptolaemus montrouzieri]
MDEQLSPEEILSTVNEFFLSQVTASKMINEPSKQTSEQIRNSSVLLPTDAMEIKRIILALRDGTRQVTLKYQSLLKHVAHELAEPLSSIINVCFDTGVFPQTTAIHKKGNKESIGNYRPIALLSNINVPEDMVMFADDTLLVLFADSESIEDRVFETLDKLDLWFTENELVMNVGKTQIVEFNYSVNSKRTVYNKRKGTATLELSESVYFLEVHLDHRLNWNDHIDILYVHMARYAYTLKVLAST